MNSKLKSRSLWAVLFAALVACIGITAAYLTSGRFAVNKFTIGENSIEIEENFKPLDKMEAGDNIYKKAINVRNTGSVPCYVRVFMDFSDSGIRDISQISSDDRDSFHTMDSLDWLPADWVYIPLDDPDSPLLGGFFYYTGQVEPGKDTGYLLTDIKTTFADESDVEDYEVIVTAESVQVRDVNGEEFAGAEPWKQAWQEFLERRTSGSH